MYAEIKDNVVISVTKWPMVGYVKITETDQRYLDFVEKQELEPTDEEIYDTAVKNNKMIKALVLSLNNVGSFTTDGVVLSGPDLKTLIKSNM